MQWSLLSILSAKTSFPESLKHGSVSPRVELLKTGPLYNPVIFQNAEQKKAHEY